MEQTALLNNLAKLKRKLSKMVEETGSLVHPNVVAISQEMDILVVKLQRLLSNMVR